MRSLFVSLLLCGVVQAQTLDELIDYSTKNHGSLQSIKERIEATAHEKKMSRNFADPEISLTINDIQFDAPTDRTLEPMQFSSLNIKQKIPYFGKRDAQTKLVESKRDLLTMDLQELQTQLAKEIRITAYSLWQSEQKLALVQKSMEIIKESIRLNKALYIASGNTQSAIVTSQLLLDEQKLKKSALLSQKETLLQQLAYLSGQDVSNLELSLAVQKPKTLQEYEQSVNDASALHVKDAELKLQKADLHIKELSQKIDPYIQAGYYYRENHPDYASITVGASIPLYGTQEQSQEEAEKLVLAKGYEKSDLILKLDSQVAGLYAKLQNEYESYEILSKESLPKIEQLLRLTQISEKSRDVLFEYLDILNKKIKIQEQLIDITTQFNQTQAQIAAINGEKI